MGEAPMWRAFRRHGGSSLLRNYHALAAHPPGYHPPSSTSIAATRCSWQQPAIPPGSYRETFLPNSNRPTPTIQPQQNLAVQAFFFSFSKTVHRPADGGLVTVVGSARMARRRGFSEEFSRNQKEENHEYLFGDKSFDRIKSYPPFHLSLLTIHCFSFFLSFFPSPHSFASTPPCAYN